MYIKNIFFFLLCLLNINVFSQASQDELKSVVFGNPFSIANQNAIRTWNRQDFGTDKEMFQYESWRSAEIQSNRNESIALDSVNYSIVDDKVYFISRGKLFELYKEQVKLIKFGDEFYMPLRYKDDKKNRKEKVKHAYFNVLSDGTIPLLSKSTIKKKNRSDHPMGIKTGNEEVVTKKETFYYYDRNKNYALKLPKKKKDFLKVFKSKKVDMLRFVKENDISTSSRKGLMSAFDYYNQILSPMENEETGPNK